MDCMGCVIEWLLGKLDFSNVAAIRDKDQKIRYDICSTWVHCIYYIIAVVATAVYWVNELKLHLYMGKQSN